MNIIPAPVTPPDLPPRCTSPVLIEHGLHVYLPTLSISASRCISELTRLSAKCNLVRKPHANLPGTPVALTSAAKYLQMLPAPPGALQCALGLCKSIPRCSWKHLQLWRCIQDATRLTIRIVKFWSCWNLCTGLQGTSRSTETSAQLCRRLWEQLRPLRKLCRRLGAKFSQQ